MRIVLSWLVMVLVSLLLVTQLMALRIEQYKSVLETAIGEAAGVTIRIGQLHSESRMGLPELILDEVEILPARSSQNPMTLKQVRLRLDWWELFSSRSLISASHVQLLGADISVTRNTDGVIQITGFNSQSDQPLWLWQVGAIDVFESRMIFQDEMTGRAAQQFDNIKLWLNNHQQSEHEIRLQFDLPHNLGYSALLAIQLQGDAFSSKELTGHFYLKSNELNISTITHLASLTEGNKFFLSGLGGLEVWGGFKQAALTEVSGHIDLSQLNVFSRIRHQAYLKSVKTWFRWHQKDNISTFELTKLSLDNGVKSWAPGNLSVSWSEDLHNGGHEVGLSLTQMPLAMLGEGSDFLRPLELHPLPQLKKWSLSGIIQKLNLEYHTVSDAGSVKGRFDDVGFLPIDHYPGVKHLTAQFTGTEKYLKINLDSQGVRFVDRHVFEKPLEIQSLSGLLELHSNDKKRILSSDDLAVTIGSGVFHNRFRLMIPELESDTFLSFQSQLKAIRAEKVTDYLPVKILDDDLAAWLQQAFFAGELKQADFLFHGPLTQYPFVKGDGVVEALIEVQGLGLQYEPQWPVFTGVDSKILFLNDMMYGVADQWLLNGSAVLNSEFLIPSLTTSDHVWVKGEVVGKIEKTLSFLSQTPLNHLVAPLVDQFSVQGENHLLLDMKLPIVLAADAHVNGVARLTETSLALSSANFVVQKIHGELGFSEQGLYTTEVPLKGEALGFPVSAEVENLSQVTQVLLNGYTDVNHLDAFFPSKGWSLIKGGADYQFTVAIPKEPLKTTELLLSSNLSGIQEQFSDQKAPLDADFQVLVNVGQGSVYDAQLRYGSHFKAALLLDAQTQQVNAAHVVVGEGKPDTPTQPGFAVTVKQEEIDLERWLGLARGLEGSHDFNWNSLNLLTVDVDKLMLKNGALAEVALSLNHKDGLLLGRFNAGNTRGAFQWPVHLTIDEVINLDLQALDILEMNGFYQQLAGGAEYFRKLPQLQLISEQFFWRGIDLGQLKLTTTTLADRLKINTLSLVSDEHLLRLKGRWFFDENETSLVGQLESDDFGLLLTEMAITDELLGGAADIDFTLNWSGQPTAVSRAKLNGFVRGSLGKGSLLGIEPGIGRVLGAFNLSEWRRRLELDFSDMFGKGLAFNQVSGSFNLLKGQARTQDLVLDGVSVKIAVAGNVDLVEENVRQMMTLTPKTTALIPFAGTIAGKMVETLTGSHPDELTQLQYLIEGPWLAPEVTRVYDNDGLLQQFWTEIINLTEEVR